MGSKQQSGVENRRYKRYGQPGEAQIFHLGSTSAYSGHVLDLSEGGCRVKLGYASFLKTGMVVEVSMHFPCAAFRAVATVTHVSEDRSTIGIGFANIGRRARSDLLDLLAELEAAETTSATLGKG
jgi:hypothetical protein